MPQEWFEELYSSDPDPWKFSDSDYERRKRAVTLASLPRSGYRSAFEPGCSFGALTRLLAPRCEQLLATDVVASVVERAATAVAGWPGVRVVAGSVPDDWPEGSFDLIVLSEIGYYLTAVELDEVIGRAVSSLDPGGHLVAIHWLGTTDYPLDGAEVHARIGAAAGLEQVVGHDEPAFALRCWERG